MKHYELRIYDAAVGRSRELHSRMRDHLAGIFSRLGIPRVGAWDAISGDSLPQFYYLLEWADDAIRRSAWASFYQDSQWLQVREKTNAGSELVESGKALLLNPIEIVSGPELNAQTPMSNHGDIHELLTFDLTPGTVPAALDSLKHRFAPLVEKSGGTMIASFLGDIGDQIPCIKLLLSWQSISNRQTALADFEANMKETRAKEMDDMGRTALCRMSSTLLAPTQYC